MRFWPDPILSNRSSEVISFDYELQRLVQELFRVLDEKEALGVAAPQVGVLQRVFVTNDKGNWVHPVPNFPHPMRRVFVNPTIIFLGNQKRVGLEGCLSFPDVLDHVERAAHIRVEAQDPFGERFSIEASGLYGACIQHEADHLDGITMDLRLGKLARSLFLTKCRKRLRTSSRSV